MDRKPKHRCSYRRSLVDCSNKSARDMDCLSRYPSRVLGREKHRCRPDVFRLADPAKWRLRFSLLAEVALHYAHGMHALCLDHSWIEGVYANLAWTQFLGKRFRDGIDCRLRGAIDRGGRRGCRARD